MRFRPAGIICDTGRPVMYFWEKFYYKLYEPFVYIYAIILLIIP